VASLGGSENATKQEHFQAKWHHLAARKMRPNRSIFKPSGITWRLGKCDQTGAFSSQVASLGGSENATEHMPSGARGQFWVREDQPESHH
jgi:hypothetical protein